MKALEFMDAPSQVTLPAERPPWGVIAPLCLTLFIALMMASALGPFAADIADDLDTSVALVGQFSTLALGMLALCGIISGPLADRYGHRRSILTGLSTMACSALLMSVAPALPVILVAGLIGGVGASMTFGVTFAVAASRFTGDARRIALSRIQASQTMGSVIGAPILTTVAAVALWRGAYVFVAAAMLISVVLITRALPADPDPEGEPLSIRSILANYEPLIHDRGMVRLYVASALRAFGWVGPVLYLGAFVTEVHDLSLRQVGLAYMVTGGGLFVGNLAVGGWLGRFDLRVLFAVSTALLGLGWLTVFTLQPPILPTLAVAAATAFAGGVGWICLTTLLASETPAKPATTMVLNGSVFGFGSAMSSAAGGVLIALGGFQLLGIAFPLFTLAAALITWQPRLVVARAFGRGV
jgi:predicted MFS family arabinose efflux permease